MKKKFKKQHICSEVMLLPPPPPVNQNYTFYMICFYDFTTISNFFKVEKKKKKQLNKQMKDKNRKKKTKKQGKKRKKEKDCRFQKFISIIGDDNCGFTVINYFFCYFCFIFVNKSINTPNCSVE